MALFENESIEDLNIEEDKNSYLDDPKKGIELIKSMLDRHKKIAEFDSFDEIISKSIFPIIAELKLTNELELYKMLVKADDKIKEQKKIQLLQGKKVLGIGGKFSAGKSCFINSISNAELPEGQRPTTSIATYIVNAKNKSNLAICNCDNSIELDDEAVLALTHKFYERYNIGFSRLLKNLVVYTPNFTYPNIAILDTPGYSKSDSSKDENVSDAEIAREQLKSVDYLIWLVDSVQGVVTQRDIEFMSSLNISTPILVVFTKAALESKENLQKKIAEAKRTLNGVNKEIFDVIAYDSMDKVTIIGDGVLEKYLAMINDKKINQDDIVNDLKSIDKQLNKQLNKQIENLNNKIATYEKILINTDNIEHIKSITNEYSKCKFEVKKIKKYIQILKKDFIQLINLVNDIKVVK
ncbi:MAG: dynamin family protein [Clostridium sp.]|nr:dynamin family protein [Clostridium sp.]